MPNISQLDLFTKYDGPGFYTVHHEHAIGGGGHCRWYDSEIQAQAQMQAWIDQSKQRGERKASGYVRLHDHPPLFARRRDAAWRAAASGLAIVADGLDRFQINENRLHPDHFLTDRKAAA